jgi:hypothetical protein
VCIARCLLYLALSLALSYRIPLTVILPFPLCFISLWRSWLHVFFSVSLDASCHLCIALSTHAYIHTCIYIYCSLCSLCGVARAATCLSRSLCRELFCCLSRASLCVAVLPLQQHDKQLTSYQHATPPPRAVCALIEPS